MSWFKSKFSATPNIQDKVTLIEKYNDYLIVPEKRKNALLRLFCFPCAGGNASAYSSKWFSSFPKSIEYVAVQPPGRQNRIADPYPTDLYQLVDEIVDSMTSLISVGNKPYAFFGHSLGSIIAYECALEIRRRKLPLPLHLYVSGRGAPGSPDPIGNQIDLEMGDRPFADECIRHFGPAQALLDSRFFSVSLPPLRNDIGLYYKYQDVSPFFTSSTSTRSSPSSEASSPTSSSSSPLPSPPSSPPLPAPPPLHIPLSTFGCSGDPLSQPHLLSTWRPFTSSSFNQEVIDDVTHRFVENKAFKEKFSKFLSALCLEVMEKEEVWC